MRYLLAIFFLLSSVMPFVFIQDKWAAVTHVGSTDIFAQESFAQESGILGESGLFDMSGSSAKFRFELFERMLTDKYVIGNSIYTSYKYCSDEDLSKYYLDKRECSELISKINDTLDELNNSNTNESIEIILGNLTIGNLKSTSSRTKRFIELRMLNENRYVANAILKSVLFGIDEELKKISLLTNSQDYEILESSFKSASSQDQKEYLSQEMTKLLIGIQKAKTSGRYSFTILIEPYSFKISSLIVKALFFTIFITLSLISIYHRRVFDFLRTLIS